MDEKLKRLILSIPEAAEVLGVSKPLVYQLVHRADFPAFKVGSRILISAAQLEHWVEAQAGEGACMPNENT